MSNADESAAKSKPPVHHQLFAWSKEKVIAGVILLFLSGTIAWWSTRAPDLQYTIGTVKPSKAGDSGTFDVIISNNGSKFVEGVECEIKIENCEIQEIEFDSTYLKAKRDIAKDGTKADIEIPMLNSGDKITATIKATNPVHIASNHQIRVRGKDVNSSKHDIPKGRDITWIFVVCLIGLLFFMIIMSARETVQKAYVEKRMEKVIRFLNGPAENMFLAGKEAQAAYAGSISNTKSLLYKEMNYRVWLIEKSSDLIKVEMFCELSAARPTEKRHRPEITLRGVKVMTPEEHKYLNAEPAFTDHEPKVRDFRRASDGLMYTSDQIMAMSMEERKRLFG